MKASGDDWPVIWSMLQPVFQSGETYAFSRSITEEEARDVWMLAPNSTYVARDAAGALVGTYYLKTNFPGQGSHVCNCGCLAPLHQPPPVAVAQCFCVF